jgi:hypothetical protein
MLLSHYPGFSCPFQGGQVISGWGIIFWNVLHSCLRQGGSLEIQFFGHFFLGGGFIVSICYNKVVV